MGGVAPTLCTDLNTCILYQIRCVQVGGEVEVRTLQAGAAALHISPMSPSSALHTLTISYLQIFSGNVYQYFLERSFYQILSGTMEIDTHFAMFAERWFSDSLAQDCRSTLSTAPPPNMGHVKLPPSPVVTRASQYPT